MTTIRTKGDELDLNDQATIAALKSTDVVAEIKAAKRTARQNKYVINLSDAEVERLARLSATGDWHEAIDESIKAMLVERIGRATISSPSQYSQKITGPSAKVRYQ